MQAVTLRPITNVDIEVTGTKVVLPSELQTSIDAHWRELSQANPHIFNGEAFSIVAFEDNGNTIHVKLAETDYAHCMYTEHFPDKVGDYGMRIIHSAALVITSDEKLIFGAMSAHSARAGIIVCSGGGIDNSDIRNAHIDLEHSTAHELQEELGIDLYDKQRVRDFRLTYLKSGGVIGTMTAVYIVALNQTSGEFMQAYQRFADDLRQSGKEVEFGELFAIQKSKDAVESFLETHGVACDEYMPPLLRAVV